MNNCTVMIRNMREVEIEECAAVIRKGFSTIAERFGLTPENCPTNGAFIKADRLRSDYKKGVLMYVLVHKNAIIGYMQLNRKEADRLELEKLTVLLQYRHYGYGAQLLHYAAQVAKKLGVNRITIGIIEENTVLKDWYMRNGFCHNGTKVFDQLPFTVGFMSLEV